MENSNGKFRQIQDPYTMVINTVIEDKNLSLKAKGLYLIIKHYITIPNFVLRKNHLMSLSKEGERAFDSTWKELKDSGYLKQYRLKGNDGKWIYEYELLHEPIVEVKEKEEAKENKVKAKKPSASAKANDFNNYNNKVKQSNNIISKSNKKDTKKSEENQVVNNGNDTVVNIEALEAIKNSGVNIKKTDLEQCQIEFTDLDKLKKALKVCEDKNSHGIKNVRLAYNQIDKPFEQKVKTKFHNVNATFTKYENNLEEVLKDNQSTKFSNPIEELYCATIGNNNFGDLTVSSRELVLEYAKENKLFIPNSWLVSE